MARPSSRSAGTAKAPDKRAPARGGKGSAAKKSKASASASEPSPKEAKRVAPKPAPADGYIAVAEVARPHGVQGELRLKIYNPDSDLLTRKPRIRLRLADGAMRDSAIVSAREANKALLVRLAGVDDRDAAEALRGAEVCVPRESFPALEEGEFYACDIEGARAVLQGGEEVGHVTGLLSYPTCDVILVEKKGGGRIEVPLLDPYVAKIDVAGGVVELVTIDGLE